MSHIVDPGPKRVKQIRFKPPGRGADVKVSAFRDLAQTRRLKDRIDSLIASKLNGDPPPKDLSAWIDNMPERIAGSLIKVGLLDRRRTERANPIDTHIDDYRLAVQARRGNTINHAKAMAGQVRCICKALSIEFFNDIREHDVLVKLDEWSRGADKKKKGMAPNTVRHYLVAMCDFCKWMVREKRAGENPMPHTSKPSAEADERRVRRPLTVGEFRKLMVYLDTFEFYPKQQSRWTAADRKILYWTAVCTAYRQDELRALRRYKLFLDDKPPAIDIAAKDAKNRTAASVPIPADLTAALREYVRNLHPASPVFSMPVSRKGIMAMFQRDLKGAGIESKWATGEVVDFHALRSSAITWWLDEYELSPKRVQVLARLKTLALVARYSRKFRIENFAWLDRAPKLISDPVVPGISKNLPKAS